MIRTIVTRGSVVVEDNVRTWVRCDEHSGQRMPTGVGVMQLGQMGRPHEEQDTAVSREGWR
ncbi:MAG TPA: hypothetical protein VGC83_16325 [Solirubrobacteraceae bacterium]|jgi:hypothetical protein